MPSVFKFALLAVSLLFFLHGTEAITFQVINNCPFTIWPASLPSSGGWLSSTGFELAPYARNTLGAPWGWSGRLWARTGCWWNGSGRLTCATGDCGSGQFACNGAGGRPPASLVEFTLNGFGDKDYFDISLVDGFNLPVAVIPRGGWGCASVSCMTDINRVCPGELQLWNNGAVVGCRSACEAFNSDNYCCRGAFNKPQTCPPTYYSKIFKNNCPQAYSYAYDDATSTFTCGGGANYDVVFCPSSASLASSADARQNVSSVEAQ